MPIIHSQSYPLVTVLDRFWQILLILHPALAYGFTLSIPNPSEELAQHRLVFFVMNANDLIMTDGKYEIGVLSEKVAQMLPAVISSERTLKHKVFELMS